MSSFREKESISLGRNIRSQESHMEFLLQNIIKSTDRTRYYFRVQELEKTCAFLMHLKRVQYLRNKNP